ncbi:phosphatidylinositol mannoside acyltransferase [Micromonospora sp. NBC_01699]|uniref:phosphatidylinositol mannoside acyltransferase n=1 Tax=Micromonospora sp. NBC_01699 TaxID=2975984 RepID=UPI002E33D697|nr:phosphatidylinositol mannoside acyltransferase [Micromonospora sp. NBC_01699]
MNLVELGYLAGWRITRAVPKPLAAAVFRLGADRAFRRGGPGVKRLAGNLRQVVGPDLPSAEFDQLVRRALRSYGRYWLDLFRLPSLSHAQRLATFELVGTEMLAADVAAGRGAVIALPHGGNWDAAGAWVAAMGWPITTVAERLKPEAMYTRFLEFRQGLGMEIIPLSGGQQPPFDVLAERIRQGHVVPLLADRDLTRRGIEVRFFGARTRMPAGPALLALSTGAPLYVASMWYEPDKALAELVGPLELPDPASGTLSERVRVLTQDIADHLAAGIAQHPEDWHMLQRMWLTGDDRAQTDPVTPAAPGPA